MSVILQAPVPAVQTTTVLPNPQFNDSEARRHAIQKRRAMDGTLYTYVQSNNRSRLNYTFRLARMKALELRAFVEKYFRAKVRLRNHKDEVWTGYFTANPFEFTAAERAGGQPGGELVEITLEFEGDRISAGAISEC